MSEIDLKTLIFYVTATFALVAAAPAPGSMLLGPGGVSGSGELVSISTEAPANDARTDNNPLCSTPDGDSTYNVSVSSLLYGQQAVAKHLETIARGQCEERYRRPIWQRISLETSGSVHLHVIASVLQAYSDVALLATQTDTVPEEEKTKMQIVHELLSGLIQNYHVVISPNHCSCTAPGTSDCVTIEGLQLNLTRFPSTCNPAAYVSDSIFNELSWMIEAYKRSSTFMTYGQTPSSCQQWINDYIPANSLAHSHLTCPCTCSQR